MLCLLLRIVPLPFLSFLYIQRNFVASPLRTLSLSLTHTHTHTHTHRERERERERGTTRPGKLHRQGIHVYIHVPYYCCCCSCCCNCCRRSCFSQSVGGGGPVYSVVCLFVLLSGLVLLSLKGDEMQARLGRDGDRDLETYSITRGNS